MELTLEIAGRTLFSVDLAGPAREVGDIFNRLNELFAKMVVSPVSLLTMRDPLLAQDAQSGTRCWRA